MDWVDRPKNYKGLYRILQLLQGSHFDNFQQKTLKLGRVPFHSVTCQFQCLDFQSNQYKKLAPVLSHFCNGLLNLCMVWGWGGTWVKFCWACASGLSSSEPVPHYSLFYGR